MSNLALADPVLAASIYASGQIDSLLEDAVAPFWRRFRDDFGAGESYLWCLRYELGGEHLKLRVHAPAGLRPEIEKRLSEAVEPVLFRLRQKAAEASEPPAATQRIPGWLPPAIDVEDGSNAPRADLALVFTQYRRSFVSLGDRPFLADDRYVALLTRCLGRGCDEVLALAADPGEGLAQRRQLTLWLLLVSGLALRGDRLDYLAYHRDWLIRFPLLRLKASSEQGKELLKRFETICSRREGQREFLGRWTRATWSPGLSEAPSAEPQESPFVASLRELLDYLPTFAALPDARLDPFTRELAFPVLFKLFHGLANQLGLSRFDEAFACHLLLRSAAAEGQSPLSFELLPVRKGAA